MGLSIDTTIIQFFVTTIFSLIVSKSTFAYAGDASGGAPDIKSYNGFLRKSDYPFLSSTDNKNNKWTSVSHMVEFLPADESIDIRRLHVNDHEVDAADATQQQQQKRQQNQEQDENDQVIATTRSNFHYPERELYDYNGGSTSSGYGSSQYDKQPFVEGGSDYSSYQQAWRMLGFMIDCDADTSYSYNNRNNNHNSQDKGDYLTGEGCQRYVVWAAYVDLDYQGGGIGEYQYWNREMNMWDTTTCNYASSSNNNKNNKNNNKNNNNNNNNENTEIRCAKMDCHLSTTHWQLLGFYKHRSYDDWMEQLFKHEGVCVWSDDEYSFMKNARKTWPQGCTTSNVISDKGDQIYYDLKPTSGGGITLGLYTDTKCVVEYKSWGSSDPVNIENVIGNTLAYSGGSHDSKDNNNKNNNNNNNNQASDYTFEQSLAIWDKSFDAFKICQPCVAHDLDNYGYNVNDDASRGSNYGKYRYGYDDDYVWRYYGYYYSQKGSDFDCYDDAGYTNVNQCMKFMAKTTMNTATFRDISLANSQGTLVSNPLSGVNDGTMSHMSSVNPAMIFLREYAFLFGALIILIYGVTKYRQGQRDEEYHTKSGNTLQQNLVLA